MICLIASAEIAVGVLVWSIGARCCGGLATTEPGSFGRAVASRVSVNARSSSCW